MTELLPALLIAAVVFFAAMVGGIAGFGFALVGLAALTFTYDPKTAVIAFSVVAPLLNVVQLYHHRTERRVATRLRTVFAFAAVGSMIGTTLLLALPTWVLSIALGCFALFYVASALRRGRPPLRASTERKLGPVVGLAAGVFNGSLGASGPVLGTYLHAIGLHKRQFAFAISAVFLLMGVFRIASLATLGAYTLVSFATSAALFVPAALGQHVGFSVQSRIDQRRFELAVIALLTLSALNLIIKGIQGAGAA
jgi:uncharacterized membrane protein YfcA